MCNQHKRTSQIIRTYSLKTVGVITKVGDLIKVKTVCDGYDNSHLNATFEHVEVELTLLQDQ